MASMLLLSAYMDTARFFTRSGWWGSSVSGMKRQRRSQLRQVCLPQDSPYLGDQLEPHLGHYIPSR